MASGPELSRNRPLAMYRTQTSQPGVQFGVLFELLYTLKQMVLSFFSSWIFSVMLLGPNEWILENFNENRRNKNNFWLN